MKKVLTTALLGLLSMTVQAGSEGNQSDGCWYQEYYEEEVCSYRLAYKDVPKTRCYYESEDGLSRTLIKEDHVNCPETISWEAGFELVEIEHYTGVERYSEPYRCRIEEQYRWVWAEEGHPTCEPPR